MFSLRQGGFPLGSLVSFYLQKYGGGTVTFKMSLDVNQCETVRALHPANDVRPIQGVFPPHTQCSQDKLRILREQQLLKLNE